MQNQLRLFSFRPSFCTPFDIKLCNIFLQKLQYFGANTKVAFQLRPQSLPTILFLLIFSPASYAGIINVDFTKQSPLLYNELNYSFAGLNLAISGWYEDSISYDLGQVHQDTNGLGVFNSVTSINDGSQIDGRGPDEWLRFDFSSRVNLLSVQFNRVGNNDDFSLLIDNVLVIEDDIPGSDVVNDFGVSLINFEPNKLIGYQFQFGVNKWFSDYKISAISIKTIPEPNTFLLYCSVLLFIGVLSISKKLKRIHVKCKQRTKIFSKQYYANVDQWQN